jgi:hypothetical protein
MQSGLEIFVIIALALFTTLVVALAINYMASASSYDRWI